MAQPVTWSGHNFGIHQVRSYQNSHLDTFLCQYDLSNNLVSHLNDSSTLAFQVDLGTATTSRVDYWYDTATNPVHRDHQATGLDTVDLFFTATHGSADDTNARWSMWQDNWSTGSEFMRLGDDADRLSIFASYSCHALQWDTKTVQRWEPVFMGGLRMALGSHDVIHIGAANDWVGSTFADHLHDGWSIKAAWQSGLSVSSSDNDSAALVTGTNSTDCFYRLDSMTWYNFSSFDRRGDPASNAPAQINYWCISRRTNG